MPDQPGPTTPNADPLAGWHPRETDREFKTPTERKHAWTPQSAAMVLRIVGLFAVAGVVIVAPIMSRKITAWTPSVGDCVTAAHTDEDVKSVKGVDCEDAAAASKVIAVYQSRDINDIGSYQDPCANVPDWDSEIFVGKPHNGFILCLKDTK